MSENALISGALCRVCQLPAMVRAGADHSRLLVCSDGHVETLIVVDLGPCVLCGGGGQPRFMFNPACMACAGSGKRERLERATSIAS